ncbi:MAG TPA: hypothetical protein VGY76_03935 [Solirubrobacteraceae bacterium]|nr:hypothetical protein [Solirubrobacteraceae bacterium]
MASKRWPKRLPGVSAKSRYLGLAELPLRVVLMMHHHARAARMLGYQQQCWYVSLIACVADDLLDVSIPPSYGADEQIGHGRDRESQQLSQTPAQALCIHAGALYGRAQQRGVLIVVQSRRGKDRPDKGIS